MGTILCVLLPLQGEIRACAFNEMADKYQAVFEMNKVRGGGVCTAPLQINFSLRKKLIFIHLSDNAEGGGASVCMWFFSLAGLLHLQGHVETCQQEVQFDQE